MTNSIEEIAGAEVILVIGSNTTEAHPQVARRIIKAVDRGARLIVADPRRTALSRFADIHLQLRPGTDIALLNAMMRVILAEGLVDDVFIEMRTENYNALRDTLYEQDFDELAAVTGISPDLVKRAARLYAGAQQGVVCYCLGITQHICGTANVESIANLAMITGHVEQSFTGVNPLRGQNNVQGACDMGALPAVFPGYQPVTDEAVRQKFERAWGRKLPSEPGLTLMAMTHGGLENGIRAMFIMGENPVMSDPDASAVEKTLEGLDFLAVSDIFLTETARCADVVFPAASFAEKIGTVTNSERRVQLMHQSVRCWSSRYNQICVGLHPEPITIQSIEFNQIPDPVTRNQRVRNGGCPFTEDGYDTGSDICQHGLQCWIIRNTCETDEIITFM
jgi:formate dehydrogenase major subunit/formate dehydrogenase alpha subunit